MCRRSDISGRGVEELGSEACGWVPGKQAEVRAGRTGLSVLLRSWDWDWNRWVAMEAGWGSGLHLMKFTLAAVRRMV